MSQQLLPPVDVKSIYWKLRFVVATVFKLSEIRVIAWGGPTSTVARRV